MYLKAYLDGWDAKAALAHYFRFYNNERPHQALDYRTPAAGYNSGRPVDTGNTAANEER